MAERTSLDRTVMLEEMIEIRESVSLRQLIDNQWLLQTARASA